MPLGQEMSRSWRVAIARTAAAWRPLVGYEVLISLFATAVLGPIAVALSYRLIDVAGEVVLGHEDLAAFALSPIGTLTLVVGLSLALGLLWIQYSGLILLIHGALREDPLTVRNLLKKLIAASPRLFGLATIQTLGAIGMALPFLLLAAGTYWALLSEADINYYLSERPPRFWLAVALGMVLALGLSVSTAWFVVRFAFALPACALDGQTPWAALRSSFQLVRGRAVRLLALMVVWQLLEQAVFLATIAGLDRVDHEFATRLQGQLAVLVWSTVALLLLDAAVLQVVGAIFAIGRALILTYAYEQAQGWQPGTPTRSGEPTPIARGPRAWWRRVAVAALLLAAPAASLLFATTWAHEFVERRPVRVTAHRAGSRHAPENSIAALRLSIAAGADCVEIDVQQTADGQVVLMHDRDLRRTTGDPRDVIDVTLADLAPLRLRGSGASGDDRVPTLAEFLAACDDRIRLNVELKETTRAPNLPPAVVGILREQKFLGRAGVSCFRLPPLSEIRRAEPEVPIGMILSVAHGDAARLPVDFLSLNRRIVRADLVRRAHRKGLEVHAWTVNDQESALRLLDLGCDNLITSDPVLMRQVVDWYAGLGDAERVLMRLRRWMRE